MKHKGFTLIELMLVIAIVGILAAVAVPQYQKYVLEKAYHADVVQMQQGTTLLAGAFAKIGEGEYCVVGDEPVVLTDRGTEYMTFEIGRVEHGIGQGCPPGRNFVMDPVAIPYFRDNYRELL